MEGESQFGEKDSRGWEQIKKGLGFPGGSDGKESVCSEGDQDSIPGLDRSPGVGNGNPLQHSCLENPRGAWRATVHGVAKWELILSIKTLLIL